MKSSPHIIEAWQRGSAGPKKQISAIRLRALYESLARHLFSQYEPTKKLSSRVSRDFLIRLDNWLECFSSEDERWTAFRSIEYVFFAGQQEFEELYRCAMEHKVVPWLLEVAGIDIFSADAEKNIAHELEGCWPCPVTDSLRINSFLHVTGLPGQGLRPDWLSLRSLGSKERIASYVKMKKIEYLVLLEDFVGSGGQVCRALEFAAEAFDGPIILIPLIVCAPGDRAITDAVAKIGRKDISYRPVLVLDDACLVGEDYIAGEPKLFAGLREAIKSGYKSIGCDLDGGAFGWEGVGSLAVLYSNCPNNSPPIFHHQCSSWKPIFPRSIREF